MPKFGNTSKGRLNTCHPYLQLILNKVIQTYDCTILCGFRAELGQNTAFEAGKSMLAWPESKHNNMLGYKPYSLAIDVGPWPLDWDDIDEFKHLGGRILQAADCLGIPLVWGGNWTTFKDYPHYQLIL